MSIWFINIRPPRKSGWVVPPKGTSLTESSEWVEERMGCVEIPSETDPEDFVRKELRVPQWVDVVATLVPGTGVLSDTFRGIRRMHEWTGAVR